MNRSRLKSEAWRCCASVGTGRTGHCQLAMLVRDTSSVSSAVSMLWISNCSVSTLCHKAYTKRTGARKRTPLLVAWGFWFDVKPCWKMRTCCSFSPSSACNVTKRSVGNKSSRDTDASEPRLGVAEDGEEWSSSGILGCPPKKSCVLRSAAKQSIKFFFVQQTLLKLDFVLQSLVLVIEIPWIVERKIVE